jgi:hypothetical protein
MTEETRDFLWERFTSRKLHVMVLGFVTATIFLYTGYITPQIWSDFLQFTFAIYVAGNSFEHFANQGIKLGKPKPMTKSQLNQQKNDK